MSLPGRVFRTERSMYTTHKYGQQQFAFLFANLSEVFILRYILVPPGSVCFAATSCGGGSVCQSGMCLCPQGQIVNTNGVCKITASKIGKINSVLMQFFQNSIK